MAKYVDYDNLDRFYGNIADRPVQAFDTVADMQAATHLEAGMTCHTNGFHASGDGGAAYYKVSATGTANGMDVLALQGGLFATYMYDGVANACSFGCDNTGATDVSSIVNAVTEKYILYFPEGKYLVESPIYLKQSISGSGCDRLWSGSNTLFVSGMTNVSNAGVLNVVSLLDGFDSLDLSNFNIKCNGSEYGLNVSMTDKPRNITLHDIAVRDCNTYGFAINPTALDSRNIQIYNCHAWHKTNSPDTYDNSRGFFVGPYATDTRMDNCDAMGFKVGFWIQPYSVLSNLHAYCGMTATFDATAWANSIAFRFSDGSLATNLYADSAYMAVFNNLNQLTINNFNCGYDSSVVTYPNKLNIFYAGTNGFIEIDGGRIRDVYGVVSGFNDSASDNTVSRIRLSNVYVDSVLSPTDYPNLVPSFNYNPYRIASGESGKWNEVVRIILPNSTAGSSIKFYMMNQNGYSSEITVIKSGTTLNVYNERYGSFGMYTKYKLENNVLKFYVSGSDTIIVKPLMMNTIMKMLNFAEFRNGDLTPISRDSLSSDTDLTMPTAIVKGS